MIRAHVRGFLRRLRPIIAPSLGCVILCYFLYHFVQGDHGLLAMMHHKRQKIELESDLKNLEAERTHWEQRTRKLRPESIDPDMLNEMVRHALGYVDQDDVVLHRPLILMDSPAATRH